MDNNLEFDVIFTKLDRIDAKIDQLMHYNALLEKNKLLNVQNGQLLADMDVKNKLIERMRSSLVAIKDLAELGRPEQEHLPTIAKLARKALDNTVS